MGNLLCCFCEEEEKEEYERNGVEEITLGELNPPENPQGPEYVELVKDEPIYEELDKYRPESPDYVVPRSPSYISVCEPTTVPDENPETFRLRVIAQQCAGEESEFRKFYDSTIAITPDMDSSTSVCLSHVSVYTTEMERIIDATYINPLKPNTFPEYVIYSKLPESNLWQLDISFGDLPKRNRRFLLSRMNTVQLWAMTNHVKNGKEDHGMFHLSSKPDKLKLAPCLKNVTEKVVHTITYNLDMKKVRDMVSFEAKEPNARGMCDVQLMDPGTGINISSQLFAALK